MNESLVEESLEKKMAEKVLNEYHAHLVTEMAACKRGGLESSGASRYSSGARDVLGFDRAEHAMAHAKAHEQKSGGRRVFLLARFGDLSKQ